MEGEDLVDAALAAGVEPVELLVAGENVAPELLAEVATLGHAPRVVGVFRRDALPRGRRDVTLALWRVSDPGNVGALLRAADAFGAGVALSPGCADPTGPRAARASAGALFRVPLAGWEELPARRVALVAHGGEPLPEAD
ncbi:MAG TPA: TrmH family RNA methyltransferase, partial [Gaiellaceae bacterium]|nr:TrmH family RNA methyltransferase [Gaiellaceae bacterium]